ncbi:MAG: peptidoglycan-binding domain-containing protein [Candidatus Aenigmatarchaeota archaeon]
MKKIKGVASNIYLAFSILIVVIVLGGLIYNLFFIKTATIEETKDTYALINALKAAKLYTEASLDFSVYQSVYNNSLYGGYYDLSQLPQTRKMTNELFPRCEKIMKKYEGCSTQTKPQYKDKKIFEGLKYEGKNYFDTYPVGLLQCILANLRRESDGKIYYDLKKEEVAQIDCDFKNVTKNALKGFQKDYGLSETGVVDKQTIEKLKEVFVSKWGDCSKFFDDCTDNIRTLVVWESFGSNFDPNEDKLLDELKKAIANMLSKYTSSEYNFMEYYVQLPQYSESNIIIQKKLGFLNTTIKSDDMFSITTWDVKNIERINLKIPSEITKNYPIRYLDLYDISIEKYKEVLKNYGNVKCDEYIFGDKIYHKKEISGFVINAEVFEVEKPNMLIRFNINDTTKPFPVFNGKDVLYDYINIEFLIKIPCS